MSALSDDEIREAFSDLLAKCKWCPFCGAGKGNSGNHFDFEEGNHHLWIRCDVCGAEGPIVESWPTNPQHAEAVKAWNKRS